MKIKFVAFMGKAQVSQSKEDFFKLQTIIIYLTIDHCSLYVKNNNLWQDKITNDMNYAYISRFFLVYIKITNMLNM